MAKQIEKQERTERRVTSRDVPRLLEALAGNDVEAQCDALRDLCPCRNRRYDREVWRAIFDAYASSEDASVRDQAIHAIETLRGRVRTDPRSQELVRWLAEQGVVDPLGLETAIPLWNPRPTVRRCPLRATPWHKAGLPPIPRWERGHRSRPNKQK